MDLRISRLVVWLAALMCVACSGPESPDSVESGAEADAMTETMTETTDEAADADAGAADPVEVDPDHYTVDFENEAVRILRIEYGPGEESTMHHHPDSIAIALDDAQGQMIFPDGTTAEFTMNAGDVMFSPANEHQPKNVGESPFRIIEVELKSKEDSANESDMTGPDPTEVDPDHYMIEFENEDVRVLRITYSPGEESVMHYHPDGVAVFLTDQEAEMTGPDGAAEPFMASAGDVVFVPGGEHRPKNISDSDLELVLVELK